MTRITLYKDFNGTIKGFKIDGHAGYADKGEDIVCAAISILAVNTQNSIESFCEDAFKQKSEEKSALMEFMIEDDPSHDAELLLKSFESGIIGISREYPDFVNHEYKEV